MRCSALATRIAHNARARTSRLGTARMFSTAFEVMKFFVSLCLSAAATWRHSSLDGRPGRMRSVYLNGAARDDSGGARWRECQQQGERAGKAAATHAHTWQC